jgi:hypothetical protein
MLIAMPSARPEEVAQRLSTSPSTVRDVRRRIQAGNRSTLPKQVISIDTPIRALRRSTDSPTVGDATNWRVDRAILSIPNGIQLTEWLEQTKIHRNSWETVVAQVPLGRIPQLIGEAESRAAEWTKFASALEDRARKLQRRA